MFRFSCVNRQQALTVKVDRFLPYDAATHHCAKLNASIKTPSEHVMPTSDSLVATNYYWTGSLRHNLTHFKREDGRLFEPEGITDTWRGFPSSVLIKIFNNGSIEAYTANHDRDCLCKLSDKAAINFFFKNDYFLIGLFIALSTKCFFVLVFIGWKSKQNASLAHRTDVQ